jgi:hypothetical protein
MESQVSSRSSLLRGVGILAVVMIAAGAISPAFGAAELTKAKVRKIAKRESRNRSTSSFPGWSRACLGSASWWVRSI